MIDYAYYSGCFLGTRIPQAAFPEAAARAADAMARLERCYLVTGGAESRRMALCAMAEAIYDASHHRGVASASAGSVSVHYDKRSDQALWRELYRQAAVYLDLYRGVTVDS